MWLDIFEVDTLHFPVTTGNLSCNLFAQKPVFQLVQGFVISNPMGIIYIVFIGSNPVQ